MVVPIFDVKLEKFDYLVKRDPSVVVEKPLLQYVLLLIARQVHLSGSTVGQIGNSAVMGNNGLV